MPATKSAKKRGASGPRVGAKSIRQALLDQGGNVAAVAAAFAVSRQTVYNWIEWYQLADLVELSRDTMFATAEKNINLAVQAGNLEASKFVLTHMPNENRWSSKSEIKSEIDVPQELLDLLKASGVDVKETLAELAKIIQEDHVKHG